MRIATWTAALISLIALSGSDVAARVPRHANLFGISLGAPLSLPNCPSDMYLFAKDDAYKNGLCVDTDTANDASEIHKLTVHFSARALPEFRVKSVLGGTIFISVSGDAVQDMLFYTDGVQSQYEVFTLLAKKFGKPYMYRVSTMSNAMGAKFRVIDARWTVGTDAVLFLGAGDTFDAGSIEVVTYAEMKRQEAERAAEKSNKPQL